jgi:hypothetical protein
MSTVGLSSVARVGHEVDDEVPVDRGVVFVHRGEGLLGQDVVEARCPLPGPQASGRRAVVHHEGHPTGVHEGVQSFRESTDSITLSFMISE